MKDIIVGRVGETEQGKPGLVLLYTRIFTKMAGELEIGFEQVMAALSQLDAEELVLVLDHASTLLKKVNVKGVLLKKKAVGVPHQLERNQEWTRFVLGDASINGWESFEMRSSKINKETNEKEYIEVSMRESVKTENGHVFADTGKSMSQGQAMCYAKLLRDRNDEVYMQFSEEYDTMVEPKMVAVKKVVKKTSQEVQEEKAAKDAAAAAVKQRKADEKAAEKAKKEEAKKKKEEAKLKPVVKGKAPIVVPRPRERASFPTPVVVEEDLMPDLEPVATVEAVVPVVQVVPVAAVAAVVVVKKPVKPVVVKPVRPADPFNAGEDGQALWTWKGVEYIRYEDNYVYLWNAELGEYGAFQGRYNYALDVIEECENPQLVDNE